MFEEILKEFLGTTKTFDDLFNEVFEIKDKYKNGEHISHCEKEIKDGKVSEYVNNHINLDDKKNCKCGDNVCKCNKTDNVKDENNQLKVISQFWEDSFRSAENTLIERDKKIAELERKLAKVTKEKEYLLNKFEQVKNVFSK